MTVRSQIGRFAMVPQWVRLALRGQSRALELYVLLAEIMDYPDRDAGETDGSIQRTRKWLAGELCCSPDTVDRAVATLVGVEALTVEHRYGPEGNYVASVYTVRQVAPEVTAVIATEGGDAEIVPDQSGRESAATSPHGCLEVSAPVPRGSRAGAESIPDTFFHTPSTIPPGGDVASDAAPEPDEDSVAVGRDDWWQRLTAGMGWDPAGVPDDLRGKMSGTFAAARDLGFTLDRFSDVVWLWRARGGVDVGKLRGALAGLDRDSDTRLFCHRAEAAQLVAEACAKLSLSPAGRGESQPEAELVVARLLSEHVSADRIVSALRGSEGWSHRQLQTELSRQRPVAERGVFPAAPDDLGPLLTLDLVGLLRRGLPPADVPRVAAELQDRVDGLTPGQRERMRVELSKDGFCSVNQIPVFVKALIRRLTPVDREREAKRAADMAVWGEIGAVEQPALPAGRGL